MVHEEYTFSFNYSAYEFIKWSSCGLIKAQKQDLKVDSSNWECQKKATFVPINVWISK